MMWDFIISMLQTPDAQQDAYTWGAALLGHFSIGVFVTAFLAAASALLSWVLRRIPKLGVWRAALIVSTAYLLLWEGAQIIWFGGTIADAFVDGGAVACGTVVAAGAWRNRGPAVAAGFLVLAVIGVSGVRNRRS